CSGKAGHNLHDRFFLRLREFGCLPRLGRIVVVGVCMEVDRFEPFVGIAKHLNLQFVLGYTAEEFAKSLHHIAEGKIDYASHGQAARARCRLGVAVLRWPRTRTPVARGRAHCGSPRPTPAHPTRAPPAASARSSAAGKLNTCHEPAASITAVP